MAGMTFPQLANALHDGKEPPPPLVRGKGLRRALERFRAGQWGDAAPPA